MGMGTALPIGYSGDGAETVLLIDLSNERGGNSTAY